MYGIAGAIGLRPLRPEAVAAMTALLAHRGPDDHGLWSAADGRAVLGHRRLSVIDTSSGGHQPMEKDGLVIVFNGDIYNYIELRAELTALGARFDGASDPEVILEAWRHWGADCPARFNGMFAFALIDLKARVLFAARDRYGEKPFLFATGNGFLAFASEYKALLALAELFAAFEKRPLARFLINPDGGLDDHRATLFPAITQLLPGERMVVGLNSLERRIDRYWDLHPDPEAARLTLTETAERFRDLLTDSVRLRLRADVPVGSCLSGGLDSSAIVCIARRLLGADVPYHVFTGRFPGTKSDEWEHARQVLDATGAVSHVVEPDGAGFLADLADFAWANELPVGSTSQYAQYRVFRLAREAGVTVLLDGQGADELLGGYEQYFRRYLAGLSPAGRRAEEPMIRARYPQALAGRRESLGRVLPLGLRRLASDLTGRGSDLRLGITPDLVAGLESGGDETASLNEQFAHDSFNGHLPVLLRYGDRNSMAHSREVRLPFCDHRLAEFAQGLPATHLMGEAQTKRILREAMRGILPEPIRTRWNKQGFLPPQEHWFAAGLAQHAAKVIHDPGFGASGVWRVKWWRRALSRFQAGESHLAWVPWRPLMAEAWRVYFLDRVAALPKTKLLAD
ncbi:asparagine synthase (glutamine-hydrolyzing) [Magnetospirillum sp. 15-1]|uniref:asparagine synthase (glutamine-hydrolyzing) n=1 Tax=Magnetospirillum sp. 15-1 TaxID=1979370 RepID=UPI000BBBCBF3|nr:asparagine synthase (glutamine-hydrolyzing) [Magnetospirillum sp. 15-1]